MTDTKTLQTNPNHSVTICFFKIHFKTLPPRFSESRFFEFSLRPKRCSVCSKSRSCVGCVCPRVHLSLTRYCTLFAVFFAYWCVLYERETFHFFTSSPSYDCHGVRPLVDPFRSHVSRSLFRGLSRFLLPVGE